MQRVFIETTIPSFYHDTRSNLYVRASREVTRKWWNEDRHRYNLVTSEYVLFELSRSPEPKASLMLQLLEEVEVLPETPTIKSVVAKYIRSLVMPADADGDANHLAFASVHRCDFLLTWNCKHLANANKRVHIEGVNASLGLDSPAIITPNMLMGEVQP